MRILNKEEKEKHQKYLQLQYLKSFQMSNSHQTINQDSSENTNQENMKKPIPKHTIFKLQKDKGKYLQ